MVKKTRNIFVSHVHEDDAKLTNLRKLLENNGMTVRDYSINSDKPNCAKSEDYIKREILAPHIQKCSVLVVYISPETKDSKYVNWEIEYAHRTDKRVVGVWAFGDSGCDIPDALDKYADAIVGWDGNRITDAIEGKFNGNENPDGSSAPPREIHRHSCA